MISHTMIFCLMFPFLFLLKFIDYYLLLLTIVLACVLIIVEAFAVKVNASKSTADSQNNEILFNVVMIFPLFVKFLFVLLLRKEFTCVFILF